MTDKEILDKYIDLENSCLTEKKKKDVIEMLYKYEVLCKAVLFICALILDFSRGLASHILLFIVCTVIHNCSSPGSLVFTTLRQNVREIM